MDGDIPVTGTAVTGGVIKINVANPKPKDELRVKTTEGKKLLIHVNVGDGHTVFNAELVKDSWSMTITEA